MKMNFAQRYGYESLPGPLKKEEVSDDFRKALFNRFYAHFEAMRYEDDRWHNFYSQYQYRILKVTVDRIEYDDFLVRADSFRESFLYEWNFVELFNFIEFLVGGPWANEDLKLILQQLFDTHQLAYYLNIEEGAVFERLSEAENKNLDSAFSETKGRYPAAHQHLRDALKLIQEKRFNKSIAESIHAVESVIRILTNEPKIEIPKGIEKLATEKPIHPCYKDSLKKLYAYAGDEDGARHSAIQLEQNVDHNDALFVLSTCAAFVNYLTQKFTDTQQTLAA